MFSKNTHFRLSVLASATLLWFVWMKSGASAPRMDAVSREMGALAVQQGAIAAWHAERTYNLVFALMIYLIAITLIWSHAFFGGRTPPAGEPAAAVDGPASRGKFVFGTMVLGASRWPPQIVIRYAAWHQRRNGIRSIRPPNEAR